MAEPVNVGEINKLNNGLVAAAHLAAALRINLDFKPAQMAEKPEVVDKVRSNKKHQVS